MRNLLFILLLSQISFSQQNRKENIEQAMKRWTYFEEGNPIDGQRTGAMRINNEFNGSDDFVVLAINNKSGFRKINDETGSDKPNRDDIYINMMISAPFKNVEEIFMYFDDAKTYYKLYCDIHDKGVLINYAIEKGDSSLMDKFQVINKLKSKNKVFFRFNLPYDEVLNFSFSLNNSSSALNKAMDISSISSDENEVFVFSLFPTLKRLNNLLNGLSSSVTKHSFTEASLLASFQTRLKDDLGDYALIKTGDLKIDPNDEELSVYDIYGKFLIKYNILDILNQQNE
ncbi:hypothetical protein N9484_03690 [Polaribacter sp.]|nr:hypothetical protein [Polaribacter sp.]